MQLRPIICSQESHQCQPALFGWAICHNLLLPGVAESHALAKAHPSTNEALAIMMDGISSINPIRQQCKAIHQKYHQHIDYTLEVTKQSLYLCPIVFIRGFTSCCEKCHYWLDIMLNPHAQEQQLSSGVAERHVPVLLVGAWLQLDLRMWTDDPPPETSIWLWSPPGGQRWCSLNIFGHINHHLPLLCEVEDHSKIIVPFTLVGDDRHSC